MYLKILMLPYILLLLLMLPLPLSANPTTALHLDWTNTNTLPSQDFFSFANGRWQEKNPIPPEYSSWGTFYILQEQVQQKIHQLLRQATATSAQAGSIEQKVGDFYFSGMDEATIERDGFSPLVPEFKRIQAIHDLKTLQKEIARLQLMGVNAAFNFGSMQDFKDSQKMIGAAMQGGLGLPDRDYYLKPEAKFKTIRQAYKKHIAAMLHLAGDPNATKAATEAFELETILAKAALSQIAQRDPHAIYHPMALSQLNQITPHFSWSDYFSTLEVPTIKSINLAMPEFFKTLDKQFVTKPLTVWKSYLRWRFIDGFAPYLSSSFVNEDFKMDALLSGRQKQLPRWKRVVETTNNALGFAIGQLYIKQYYSAESQREIKAILRQIHHTLAHNLQSVSWMEPKTRQAALKKLALLEERVGYPSKWWDYSALTVDRGPYVLNIIRAGQFLNKRDLSKIGKPVDRTEWAIPPQTVNAYYDPSMNSITIPAGILQPPFFTPKAAALNYGGIGFVIAHEITHAFDDQGAQFDGYGNLKNWWTAEDLTKFKAATQCLVQQFSQYKVNNEAFVQGKLVVGEAAADLGGLTLAYQAFHASSDYKKALVIDGFSPDQQFFLSTAHVWANNIRPQQALKLVLIDPHPPIPYRVNGTLANMPQFQAAFALTTPSPMINQPRCTVW